MSAVAGVILCFGCVMAVGALIGSVVTAVAVVIAGPRDLGATAVTKPLIGADFGLVSPRSRLGNWILATSA